MTEHTIDQFCIILLTVLSVLFATTIVVALYPYGATIQRKKLPLNESKTHLFRFI